MRNKSKSAKRKQQDLYEDIAIVSPASNITLDNLIKSMYTAAIKLQELQNPKKSHLFNAAVMGMSADISKMLTRFRKITSALKTGDDVRIEKTMALDEGYLRELISSLVTEELDRR